MRFIDLKHITVLFLLFCSIILNGQIEDGCVARYTFNNGSAEDDIGNNDGIVNGATLTTDRFGNVDQAYYFDGVDDYIDFGDKPEFRFGSGDFSISVWIKPDLDCPHSSVIAKVNPSPSLNNNQYSIWYNYSQGLVNGNTYGIDPLETKRLLVSNSFNQDSWNHIVLTFSFAETVMYVNGIQVDQSSNLIADPIFDMVSFPLTMGRRDSNADFYFKGAIDDLCLFERTLSDEQVDLLYNVVFEEIEPLVISGGNVGIGTITPKERLQVDKGDVYISSVFRGVILTDENGNCWKTTVNTSGQLQTISVDCPQ